DHRAVAPPGFDQSGQFEFLVGPRDCPGSEAQVRREAAEVGQPGSRCKRPEADEGGDLRPDLLEGGNRRTQVDGDARRHAATSFRGRGAGVFRARPPTGTTAMSTALAARTAPARVAGHHDPAAGSTASPNASDPNTAAQ